MKFISKHPAGRELEKLITIAQSKVGHAQNYKRSSEFTNPTRAEVYISSFKTELEEIEQVLQIYEQSRDELENVIKILNTETERTREYILKMKE